MLFPSKNLKNRSIVLRSIQVLPEKDQPRIFMVGILQVFLGFLDLAGVALIGILGSITITGIQSKMPGNRVAAFLKLVNLEHLDFQNQVAVLGLVSGLILIARTIISVIVVKKILHFLSRKGAFLSADLTAKLLSKDLNFIQQFQSQELVFALTNGINALTMGIIGNAITLLSDTSLLIILTAGLFIVDPLIAFSSVTLFGSLGLFLYKKMNRKAHMLGNINSNLNIQSNQQVVEVINTYRELVVRNRREFYSKKIANLRYQISDSTAELQFMPNVSKYVIESGIILGAIAVSGIQFLLQDAAHAIATLSIFLAAGTRIAPAIMRLQQGAIALRASSGNATTTLDLISKLKEVQPLKKTTDDLDLDHKDFVSDIEVKNINYKYPDSNSFALRNICLKIQPGDSVAIVGKSGAGKTTLVDIVLGVLPIEEGEIRISGLSPKDAIENWPGAISYVPQNVSIINSSLKENIVFGFPDSNSTLQLIDEVLELAQLKEYVASLPNGIETIVGENGSMISGGQRQRVGIARALYTKPKLLVLDEATSSLDGQTEFDISNSIQKLRGNVTLLVIAHRLSTIRHVDKVVYMESGEILAVGTFEEVRVAVPDFDNQAKLMGL